MPAPSTPAIPIFIALEGLRGCGKSTIAPLLAHALKADQVPTFPAEYTTARVLLDRHSRDPEARAHLFISALLVTASRVTASLELGRSVVIDSFAQRTAVTHRAFGADIDRIMRQNLPVPITFRLECSDQERTTRLQQRDKPTTWWDTLADEMADQIKNDYARLPAHHVDTTSQQPEQTTQTILRILTEMSVDRSGLDPARQQGTDPHTPHSSGAAPTGTA